MSLSDADQQLLHLIVKNAMLEAMSEHAATTHKDIDIKLATLSKEASDKYAELKAQIKWILGGAAMAGLILGLTLPPLVTLAFRVMR